MHCKPGTSIKKPDQCSCSVDVLRLLDVHEAAKSLGLTEASLRKHINRQSIPFKKIGRKVVFSQSDLRKWIAALDGVTLEQAIENGRQYDG